MKIPSLIKGAVVIEGHVQGLANTRALGEAGIPVIVVSEHDCLAHYSKYCNKFFHCPPYLSEHFTEFLENLAIEEHLEGWTLLPSNDHAVYNISSNLERLGKYYKTLVPEPAELEKIYNKEVLIRHCMSCGIPVPSSWFPSTLKECETLQPEFPVLVKGKKGLSFYKLTGKKAFPAEDQKSLEIILKELSVKGAFENSYIQNLIPLKNNKTVSFTAFSINGEIKTYWMGSKIREHPIQFGTATYSQSVQIPEIKELAEKLLGSLKYTGVCEIEFLFDPRDNNYKLIEVNARTWLWVGLAIKCGINYPVIIYSHLNELPVSFVTGYPVNVRWMHYITDLPFSLAGLLKGHYSILKLLRSYLEFPSPAVFRISDILPTFAEIFLLPFLIFKR
jgi:D-aspartate ligase